jgi:hypothetical protein
MDSAMMNEKRKNLDQVCFVMVDGRVGKVWWRMKEEGSRVTWEVMRGCRKKKEGQIFSPQIRQTSSLRWYSVTCNWALQNEFVEASKVNLKADHKSLVSWIEKGRGRVVVHGSGRVLCWRPGLANREPAEMTSQATSVRWNKLQKGMDCKAKSLSSLVKKAEWWGEFTSPGLTGWKVKS